MRNSPRRTPSRILTAHLAAFGSSTLNERYRFPARNPGETGLIPRLRPREERLQRTVQAKQGRACLQDRNPPPRGIPVPDGGQRLGTGRRAKCSFPTSVGQVCAPPAQRCRAMPAWRAAAPAGDGPTRTASPHAGTSARPCRTPFRVPRQGMPAQWIARGRQIPSSGRPGETMGANPVPHENGLPNVWRPTFLADVRIPLQQR